MRRIIKRICCLFVLTLVVLPFNTATDRTVADDEKPVRKITPGKVIVPTEKMRRIWGELVSVDLETRTGTFRAEGEDKIYKFAVMPYAEMLHHAWQGHLRDFEIGERAIFRLHLNEEGEWYWLTYIQDEMNMLYNHKEYYFVESLDPKTGRIGFTWAKGDKSFVRQEDLLLETNDETKFWKNGKPAKFTDINIGDKLRAKTHGVGKGAVRVCWHVFIDDESLLKFREAQQTSHEAILQKEGTPGYVDRIEGLELDLTMFQNGLSLVQSLKPGEKLRVAPAGINLKATQEPVDAQVVSVEGQGNVRGLKLKLAVSAKGFRETEVARIWKTTP